MLKDFLHDETGAITTDWVTLTSALIVVAIAVIYSLFSNGVDPMTDRINAQIESGSEELCSGDVNNCYVISK